LPFEFVYLEGQQFYLSRIADKIILNIVIYIFIPFSQIWSNSFHIIISHFLSVGTFITWKYFLVNTSVTVFLGDLYLLISSFYFLVMFSYYSVLRVHCIFWIINSYPICFANIFSQCGLSFYSLHSVCHREEISDFNEIQHMIYFINWLWLWCFIKIHGYLDCHLYNILEHWSFCIYV
jgi:hypothetical protein